MTIKMECQCLPGTLIWVLDTIVWQFHSFDCKLLKVVEPKQKWHPLQKSFSHQYQQLEKTLNYIWLATITVSIAVERQKPNLKDIYVIQEDYPVRLATKKKAEYKYVNYRKVRVSVDLIICEGKMVPPTRSLIPVSNAAGLKNGRYNQPSRYRKLLTTEMIFAITKHQMKPSLQKCSSRICWHTKRRTAKTDRTCYAQWHKLQNGFSMIAVQLDVGVTK